MSLQAALRRNDESQFLRESEVLQYHKTAFGAVQVDSVALVTLPQDHQLKHLDAVVWFDGDQEAVQEAQISFGLREQMEDWIAFDNVHTQRVRPVLGPNGKLEYTIRLYSWIGLDAMQLFSNERMIRQQADGKTHFIYVRVKACGTEGIFLFGIKHKRHQKVAKPVPAKADDADLEEDDWVMVQDLLGVGKDGEQVSVTKAQEGGKNSGPLDE